MNNYQNLITRPFHHPGPFHKMSLQSVNNSLSNVGNRQTDKQTNQSYQNYNFLCQGGNNCHGHVVSLDSNYRAETATGQSLVKTHYRQMFYYCRRIVIANNTRDFKNAF